MSRLISNTSIADFDAVRMSVASAEDILKWSYGEVLKPETINYRTQKPERDGLFCERIFGPVKDINPHDAKLKGVRSREAAVDKNGELVTKSIVRRERMAHISLAAPVAHIWFMRGTPSAMGLLLGTTVRNLERVAYFASYVVMGVDLKKKEQLVGDAEAEYEAAKQAIKLRYEKAAEDEKTNVKTLAAQQSKELETLTEEYLVKKSQLDSLEKMRMMSETDYRALPDDYSDIITVGMGGQALAKLLEEIDLTSLIAELFKDAETAKGQRKKKIMKRLKVLEGMHRAGIKPISMCLSVLPVIPPDLRPMVQLTGGRFATSDLNDLYRRVINRNNRLKKLMDLNAPEVIRRNEMRMLQEAVDALIDNSAARSGRAVSATGGRRRLKSLSDMLKGKQGRFRQNLLGKRVDYSGRSVIVAGPELKIHQCGLPKLMALELFKPFVIAWLLAEEYAHNIKSATRLIEASDSVIWDALDEVIKGKYVLLNRAPSLHRLSIQAFQPKLIEGKAIQLHPLVCKGFNADFDGDQMAVHLPLSDEAQKEARELMSATNNLLKPADGSPILNIAQDIVLGCYYLTYPKPSAQVKVPKTYSSVGEAILGFEKRVIKLQTPIRVFAKGQLRETTLGRVYFNEVMPADFPYVEDIMTKKMLNKTLARIFNKYGQEVTAAVADDIKDLALEYATVAAVSTGMTDYFEVPELTNLIKGGDERAALVSDQYEQGLITDEERYSLTVQVWRNVDKQVLEILQGKLAEADTSVSVMVNSGARGDISNVKLATAMIGVMVDATGREIELPIRSSYKHGLSPLEAFVATRGTRKGLIDTALKTADSGYLTRRLVDVSQDIFTVAEEQANDPGFAVYRKETEETMIDFGDRLFGRYSAETVKGHIKLGELITREIADAIHADEAIPSVKIMSVLSCNNLRGIPQKSYGIDMATGHMIAASQPVGVIAAQSVGEPGTQLTLNTFHAGGVAGDDITQGLPRVDELFEARSPKGQAFLSEISGTAQVWEDGQKYVVQITPTKGRTEKLPTEGRKIRVKTGTDVVAGDVIASNTDESLPLVAPFDGKVEISGKTIILTAGNQTPARYEVPGFKQLTVADGDEVEAGARLSNGSINLHDLMRLRGIEATQRYIINEVLRIYAAQGQNIADKHLEIIVRQMFSRVQIEEPGDSVLVTGDIVSKASVVETNRLLTDEGKTPAQFTQLLLGITKVSIWSDSFLSAASFQDTTRVLINAATSGRVDHLYGLKENVIIGRKIPVGTGVVKDSPISPEDIVDEVLPE
ncbi:MAG TPA: DNA-directed RNA polymerase subunit beta' [Candidatus Saccharimonadales bacterium]|jgi:DNA-directed RNA polymerase subunit beta'|nr:DNA-directed RNA polymerase subunit beta' [Candidatus Saccharimonadales bacterium]